MSVDQELNFINRKGGTVLLCSDYQYYKIKHFKNESEMWRCASYKKLKCRGNIILNVNEHCVKRSDKTSTSRLKKYTVQAEPPEIFKPKPINVLVLADPCPSCVEARWLSRICDGPELPFDKTMALTALRELSADPAYVRSDRVHNISECNIPRSRAILAKRYMNH